MRIASTADVRDDLAQAADRPDLRLAWRAVVILTVFHILSFMDRMILLLLLVPIQDHFGLSDVQLGLLQGFAFALLFAVAGLPLGWLVDRVSRRAVIFCGIIVWSVCTMAGGFARGFGSLFAARAGVGAGEASLSPAAFSLMSDLFPRNRLASAIGIYYLGANIGGALSLVLGGVLISALTHNGGLTLPVVGHLVPWQATLFLVGAPGLVLSFLVWTIHEPRRQSVSREAGSNKEFVAFLVRRRRLLFHHFLGFPLLATAVYAAQSWTAVYMARRFEWDPAAIGLAMGVAVGLFGGVANVVAGRVADTMFAGGRRDAYFRLHVLTTLIGMPLLVMAFLSPNVWLFIALFCVGKGFLTSFGGPAMATLQVLSPERVRGKLAALYLLTLTLVGSGLGPVLTALATEGLFQDRAKVGLAMMLVVAVAASLGALNLWFGMAPLRRAMQEVENERLVGTAP